MRRKRVVAVVLLVVACGDGATGWQGAVQDSAGVPIVENPATPIGGARYTVRETLRIGSATGPEATQFGLIASVAVTPDGRIVVLDQQNRQVRVFAPDGTFLSAMGTAGSGPGELSNFAIAALVGTGDTIIVADPGNGRFQWFAEGEPAGDHPMRVPTGTMPNRFALLPGMRIVGMTVGVPTPEQTETRDNLLVLVDRSGSIADTIRRMPASRSIEFRGGTAQFHAYAAETVWAVDADGMLYVASNDRWRIEVRDSSASLQRVVTRDHEAQPVTDADRRAFLHLLRRTLREQNVDPMLIEQMATGMQFADHYPAFAHFLPGPDGSLWVQRIRTARDVEPGTEYDAADVGSEDWDVFDAAGRFVATATMPPRFTPLATLDDRFYGVWRDELDIQHVMVVEVTPES